MTWPGRATGCCTRCCLRWTIVPAVWALRRGESNPEELIGNAYSPSATANGQTIVFARVERRPPRHLARRWGRAKCRRDRHGQLRPDDPDAGRKARDLPVEREWDSGCLDQAARRRKAEAAGECVRLRTGALTRWKVGRVRVGRREEPTGDFDLCPVGLLVAAKSSCDARPLRCNGRQTVEVWRIPILSNIWVQTLDGGAPSQLTHFPEDDRRIEDFEWSPDGKWLAFSRSKTTWDIVLFRGL